MSDRRSGWTNRGIAAALTLIGVLVAGAGVGAVVFGGMFAGGGPAYPPCSELPSYAEVDAALSEHKTLADDLVAQGRSVTVDVVSPCDGAESALIQVTYSSEEERASIDRILTNSAGFGVPVFLADERQALRDH